MTLGDSMDDQFTVSSIINTIVDEFVALYLVNTKSGSIIPGKCPKKYKELIDSGYNFIQINNLYWYNVDENYKNDYIEFTNLNNKDFTVNRKRELEYLNKSGKVVKIIITALPKYNINNPVFIVTYEYVNKQLEKKDIFSYSYNKLDYKIRIVNIKNNTMSLFNDKDNKIIEINYDEKIKNFLKENVHKDDLKKAINFFSIERIKNHGYKLNDIDTIEYRQYINDKIKLVRSSIKISKCDDNVEEIILSNCEVYKNNNEKEKMITVLSYMESAYKSVYYVNLAKNSYFIIKEDLDVCDLLEDVKTYSEGISKYINNNMNPEYIDEFMEITNIDYLKNRFKNQYDIFKNEYKEAITNKYYVMEIIPCVIKNNITEEIIIDFRDITDDKEKEESSRSVIIRAMNEANRANKAKSNFLYAISHDVKTPLNAIMGITDICLDNLNNPAKIKECMEMQKMASNHLLALINNLLDLSKIESGKIDLKYESASITNLIHDLSSLMGTQFSKKHLNFNIYISNIVHEYLYIDVTQLNRILVNLIGNSIKFTPNNGNISLTVSQTSSDENNAYFQIIVEDDGIGMSDDYIKKAFMPFERENSFRVSKIEGTGLGLVLTKNYVEAMGGVISIDSKLNFGTKITINIPFKINKEINIKYPFENKRIFLIDDSNSNLYDILNNLKAEVIYCNDLNKALFYINEKFDLIIINNKMPNLAKMVKKLTKQKIVLCNMVDDEANYIINEPFLNSNITQLGNEIFNNIKHTDSSIINCDEKVFEATDFKDKKVLVIDDNDLNNLIISGLLEKYEIKTNCVNNGNDGLKLASNDYDLIFLDIFLPDINGDELINKIKKEKLYDKPIIGFSANANIDNYKDCGFTDFLLKPISAESLSKILVKYIK